MTAVEWLVDQLQAPCRGIPSHIIEQAKRMEALQSLSDQAQDLNMGYENVKQFSLYEHKETITSSDTISTAPQTEISDEEIEKAMLDRSDLWNDPLCFEIGWKDAIKWYREQLKKKQ